MLFPPHLGMWHLRAALGLWSERTPEMRAEALYSHDTPQWSLVAALLELVDHHDDWPIVMEPAIEAARDAAHQLSDAYREQSPEPMHRLAEHSLDAALTALDPALDRLQCETERWIWEHLQPQLRERD